ncbi:MAG: hypothetical protein ACJAQ4_002141 [Cryomorphaceae bacterium]|jgi:hypothetical protein
MGTASEKIRTVLGLVMIILLVFITNRLDKKHFEEVQGTITEIYEDRVVAQYDLFQLTNLIYEAEFGVQERDTFPFDKNGKVETLLNEFEQTTLTKREREVFGRMKDNIQKLKLPEMLLSSLENTTTFERIHQNLEELSEIQVKESNSLRIQAQESLNSSNLMSNMEMILIIIFGIVLQFVLFSGGKKKLKG